MAAKRKSKPVTPEALRALRAQHGTKELARRMGIPAASLRRLLGKGKGAGFPKTKKAKAVLVQRVGQARTVPKGRARKAIAASVLEGTFLDDFESIAEAEGMTPREVYTLGVSPDA